MKFLALIAAAVAVASAGPISVAPAMVPQPQPTFLRPAILNVPVPDGGALTSEVVPVSHAVATPEAQRKPRVSMAININPAALGSNLVAIDSMPAATPEAVIDAANIVNVADSASPIEKPTPVQVVDMPPVPVLPVPSPIQVVDMPPVPVLPVPSPIQVVDMPPVPVLPVPSPIQVVDMPPVPVLPVPSPIQVVDMPPVPVLPVPAPVPSPIQVVDMPPVPIQPVPAPVPSPIQVVDIPPTPVEVAPEPGQAGPTPITIVDHQTSDDGTSITNNFLINVILNFIQGQPPQVPAPVVEPARPDVESFPNAVSVVTNQLD